jgi:hypothetical protein
MKHKPQVFGIVLALLLCWGWVPPLYPADMDWSIKERLDLDAPALDIAASEDGAWMFVLIRGEVLIYARPQGKLVNRIPVDTAFDALSHSLKDNTLILGSRTKKRLAVIQLALVHSIDVSGLPFRGPEDAPVTIAVFSDYQ